MYMQIVFVVQFYLFQKLEFYDSLDSSKEAHVHRKDFYVFVGDYQLERVWERAIEAYICAVYDWNGVVW